MNFLTWREEIIKFYAARSLRAELKSRKASLVFSLRPSARKHRRIDESFDRVARFRAASRCTLRPLRPLNAAAWRRVDGRGPSNERIAMSKAFDGNQAARVETLLCFALANECLSRCSSPPRIVSTEIIGPSESLRNRFT